MKMQTGIVLAVSLVLTCISLWPQRHSEGLKSISMLMSSRLSLEERPEMELQR